LHKYLYLTHKSWVHSWVHGGEVPINLASYYKREERAAIYTPDEARIDRSSMDINKLAPAVEFGGSNRNIYIGKVVYNGVVLGTDINIDRCDEDGLILSLCNKKSKNIAARLQKTACVRIHDVERLASVINEQLGVKATISECLYTTSHERNHFLKSHADSWQDEYRLFWRYAKPTRVRLPAGIATQIKI
jgi:hypothetical protein